MAKSLDFNSIQRPKLEITMCDEAKTKFHLVCPSEALIEKLEAVGPELVGVMEKNDRDAIRAVFDLAAEFISCNTEGKQVTADDLRDKYKLGYDVMIIFFSTYLDFIDEEIKNAKN
jgi:hypothetical protein